MTFSFTSLSNNSQQVQIHASSGRGGEIQYVWFRIWKIGLAQQRLQDFPILQVPIVSSSVIRESTKTVVYQEDKVEGFMKADRSESRQKCDFGRAI